MIPETGFFSSEFPGSPRPAWWREGDLLLDIEAVKVSAPAGWHQKTRFRVVVVGMGFWSPRGTFETWQIFGDDESDLMAEVESFLRNFKRVIFCATRDFDRVVLEGRWVQFRRAHSEVPGEWPHLPADLPVEWCNWRQRFQTVGPRVSREEDIASQEVLWLWGKDPDSVMAHNLLDLQEMALQAAEVSL